MFICKPTALIFSPFWFHNTTVLVVVFVSEHVCWTHWHNSCLGLAAAQEAQEAQEAQDSGKVHDDAKGSEKVHDDAQRIEKVHDDAQRSEKVHDDAQRSEKVHPHPHDKVRDSYNKSDDIYTMKSNPRGRALLINNKRFCKHKERSGTDIDAVALKGLFDGLMFTVDWLNDKTAAEIRKALRGLAEADHSMCDCVVVAILSHGKNGQIIGTDGELVPVEELTGYFQSSPSLAGKPKLFFLQACRGTVVDEGIEADAVEPDAKSTSSHEEGVIQKVLAEDEEDPKLTALRTDADFLLAYATTPGFVSWRTSKKGSWFIQALVEVIKDNACKEDLASMLTMVNYKVATECQSCFKTKDRTWDVVKQMPAPVTKLTKKLFFNPDPQMHH